MATSKDLNIEDVISDIIDGMTYRDMAKKYNIKLSTLHDFTTRAEHIARVREAQITSAQTFEEKAEHAILEAESTVTEIQRAKELAQHYRWKASKANPKRFGDKIDVTSNEETVKQVFIIGGKEIEL